MLNVRVCLAASGRGTPSTVSFNLRRMESFRRRKKAKNNTTACPSAGPAKTRSGDGAASSRRSCPLRALRSETVALIPFACLQAEMNGKHRKVSSQPSSCSQNTESSSTTPEPTNESSDNEGEGPLPPPSHTHTGTLKTIKLLNDAVSFSSEQV